MLTPSGCLKVNCKFLLGSSTKLKSRDLEAVHYLVLSPHTLEVQDNIQSPRRRMRVQNCMLTGTLYKNTMKDKRPKPRASWTPQQWSRIMKTTKIHYLKMRTRIKVLRNELNKQSRTITPLNNVTTILLINAGGETAVFELRHVRIVFHRSPDCAIIRHPSCVAPPNVSFSVHYIWLL